MKIVWDESVWGDYLWWQVQDRKALKRVNTLIKDVPDRPVPASLRGIGDERTTIQVPLGQPRRHQRAGCAGCLVVQVRLPVMGHPASGSWHRLV